MQGPCTRLAGALLSARLTWQAGVQQPSAAAAAASWCCSGSARDALQRAAAQPPAGSRGYAAAAVVTPAVSDAAASTSGAASEGPRALRPRRSFRRAVPAELEALGFDELRDLVKAMTVTNPLSQPKLALLASKASTPEELSEALRLARVNRVRATRLRQYQPYSGVMPQVLVQAAKRVGAPASFYVQLLRDAHALGLPVSANLAEAALTACSQQEQQEGGEPGGGAEFDAAWVLALAHLPRPSKHMVFLAMRSLAARGRVEEAAAVGREAAAGGRLAPAGEKLLAELEGQLAGQQQQQEGQQQEGQQQSAAE